MAPDLLNGVTSVLARGETVDGAALQQALEKVTVFRKIRLAHALKFRTTAADSIAYRIRNGKAYASVFAFDNGAGAQQVYDLVMQSITEDVARVVRGKRYSSLHPCAMGSPPRKNSFLATSQPAPRLLYLTAW